MKLSDWLDRERIAERLVTARMRRGCAELAAEDFVKAASALSRGGLNREADVMACWAPGRIEVLGKHTDYCGGRSLLAAAERGFCMVAAPREDSSMQMIDGRQGEISEFSLAASLEPPVGHWSNYPQTVARRVVRNFSEAQRGATIGFSSNLPASSGMSSSSALVVGTFLVIAGINELSHHTLYQQYIGGREALAGYLGAVENGSSFGPLQGDRGVGTFGGSEDHTAILCGRPDELVLYSYCPVRYERSVAIADEYVLAVASSGVVAEKTGAAQADYNRLSQLVEGIVEQWQIVTKRPETTLAAILASAPDAGDQLRAALRDSQHATFSPRELTDRLDQYEVEAQLLESLPPILDARTIDRFGGLVGLSQDAAERLLRNQVPETRRLVEIASELGAHATTAFGAGFGGSVWAMINRQVEHVFLSEWQNRYCSEFPTAAGQAAFFAMRPGPAALVWSDCSAHVI